MNWWFYRLFLTNRTFSDLSFSTLPCLPWRVGFLGGKPGCSVKRAGGGQDCAGCFPCTTWVLWVAWGLSHHRRPVLSYQQPWPSLTSHCTCDLCFLSFSQTLRLSEMAMPHPTFFLQPQTWCLAHYKCLKGDYWMNRQIWRRLKKKKKNVLFFQELTLDSFH